MRGQKGDVYDIEGYPMKKKKVLASGEELYHCILRERKQNCRASVAVDVKTREVRVIKEHTGHEQDNVFLEKELAKAEIRKISRAEPETRPRDIIKKVRETLSPASAAAIGDYSALRKLVYNNRPKPNEPSTSSAWSEDGGGKIRGILPVTPNSGNGVNPQALLAVFEELAKASSNDVSTDLPSTFSSMTSLAQLVETLSKQAALQTDTRESETAPEPDPGDISPDDSIIPPAPANFNELLNRLGITK